MPDLPRASTTHTQQWATPFAALSLICLVLLAFISGRVGISLQELCTVLWSALTGAPHALPSTSESIVFNIRGPRILGAMLVGAALAGAGAVYQNLFRNPLVSPDILGVSSGAALGAALAILLSLPLLWIQGFAFLGGLTAVALVTFIGNAIKARDSILSLILTGVVVASLMGAGLALAKTLADPYNQLPTITFWLMGSLSAISADDCWIAAPLILLPLVPIALLRWRVNVLSLPHDEATALGMHVAQFRGVLIVCATLMTAAAVAISGIIGWIGLLIPHAARLLVGPEFSRVLPLSLLLGAAFLLAVDTIARTVAPIEISPGILTALIGTPLFLWLLVRSTSKTSGVA